ncbi:MAG: ATP-binding protein [Rhabdochlamydiaceae bacterium]|nr:ATP-binding protein [Rhabdochlamydiaceae bacterium]
MEERFLGRERELEILKRLLTKKSASLVVIKGRRRIGKSRLIEEFGKSLKTYTFVGLPPEKKMTAQMQRTEFSRQIERELQIPGLQAKDWGDLFWHLSHHVQQGRVLIVFDEINWMGSKDPTFLGKLKTAWDQSFKKNPELIMILCGSMSSWIERNIINSTGFLGRTSLNLTLQELPLSVCNLFWHPRENLVSSYEKCKILSVIGGVPKYLEEIHPEWTAEENIKTLCFEKESFLFKEFTHIFSDLFSKRSNTYKQIIERLAEGPADQQDIGKALNMKKGGTIGSYLEDLVITGYVSQDYTWNLMTATPSKFSRYRLKDNYLRFYLKVIEPNTHKILEDETVKPLGWDAIMGLQFENLVLNNRSAIKKRLSLTSDDILFDNPFFKNPSKQHKGCQIDYLIQTKYNSLHLCEIKFSKGKIGMDVVKEVQEKILRLGSEKKFSIWPVLIHVNGVTDELQNSGFFSRIIDFGELLVF